MVEYNFSSDTRQDKNYGSQYGELQLQYITSDTEKDKTDWQFSMVDYNFSSDTRQLDGHKDGELKYQL